MSQENVEVVRRALDVFNRGEEALDLLDPEIVWTTTGVFVEPDVYRGHEDVRRYVVTLTKDFEGLHVEPDEPIAMGEHVIVPARLTGRGRLSGASVDVTFTMLFSLREGKIVRIRNYWQKADALEAVGLPE
jgi:ketosteroid isomerase-like protein